VNPINPSAARTLGADLKKARQLAGLTQGDVAQMLGRSVSYVSRCETGLALPSEKVTESMATLYRLPLDERERLIQMAKVAADKNWVMPGMSPEYASLILDEQAALSIVNVQPNFIPGPLQTETYARMVLVGAGATGGKVDQGVLVRQRRKEWLTSKKAPEYTAIIGEQALRYPECELSAMPEQLRHLLQIGKRPNVTILIVRLAPGYLKADEGRFVLMRLKSGGPIVHQEHLMSATALTDPKVVQAYETATVEIRRSALDEAKSAAFMRDLLKEMERGGT
jgi:transcriptional regulator with XRE-family HTH domain